MARARKRKIESNLMLTQLCGELLEKGESDNRKKRRRLHGVAVSACGKRHRMYRVGCEINNRVNQAMPIDSRR